MTGGGAHQVAQVIIAIILAVAALSTASSVFAPVAFALFIIALIWPLQQMLQGILPRLLALDRDVQPGARAATLQLVGQRVGAWLFAREYALDTGLALDTALPALAVPALHAFAEVELQGGQLHIRHSPLCTGDGHSGCGFYGGFLEGLLGPALARRSLSVFPVCCRSFGAGECVLAVSD